MNAIRERSRTLPVVNDVDVLVCGGGPAGVAAAVAAARTGARTSLIEMHGSLGGIWTIGGMAYVCGMHESKGGILREIQDALKGRGAVGASGLAFDIEPTKLFLEDMCLHSGVNIRLHTRVVAAQCDESNRLPHEISWEEIQTAAK